jgi:hypothetical protein
VMWCALTAMPIEPIDEPIKRMERYATSSPVAAAICRCRFCAPRSLVDSYQFSSCSGSFRLYPALILYPVPFRLIGKTADSESADSSSSLDAGALSN